MAERHTLRELYLHDLVAMCGLDPGRTRAVRNQVEGETESSLSLWRRDREDFDLHMGLCNKRRFHEVDHVVAFVGAPAGRALFVGVRRVVSYHPCPEDVSDPVTGQYKPHLYILKPTEHLDTYVERLIVSWERSRTWVRRLPGGGRPIPVVEIRSPE